MYPVDPRRRTAAYLVRGAGVRFTSVFRPQGSASYLLADIDEVEFLLTELSARACISARRPALRRRRAILLRKVTRWTHE